MKEKYSELCRTENLPIFMQDWWLDAVCGAANWQPILIFDKNEKIIGAANYFLKKKFGITIVTNPFLTPFSGVWIRPLPVDAVHKKIQYESDILSQIAMQFPALAFIRSQLSYPVQNLLPFVWQGFNISTKYTYIIDLEQDTTTIFENFNRNIRRNILKLEDCSVEFSQNSEPLYQLYQKRFEGKKINYQYDFFTLKNLVETVFEKNAGGIFYLYDGEKKLLAAAFVVFDNEKIYLIMSNNAYDETGTNSALYHLIWETMIWAKEKGLKVFDFDGSVLPNIEPFIRSFGGERKSYFQIKRSNSKLIRFILDFL